MVVEVFDVADFKFKFSKMFSKIFKIFKKSLQVSTCRACRSACAGLATNQVEGWQVSRCRACR